jgi:hypothetical protein
MMKKLLFGLMLPTLAACERQPAIDRFRLVVTTQRWQETNDPVLYKIDTVTGQTWTNGPSKDEKWYEVETEK